MINYWNEKDQEYLNKIKNKSKKIKHVIEDFLSIGRFSFWEIEKELFDALIKYPKKEKLVKLIQSYGNFKKVKLKKHFCKKNFNHPRAEITSHEPIKIDSPLFIGFYVQSGKEKEFLSILNKIKLKNVDINNLLIFDGYNEPKPIKKYKINEIKKS